MYAREQLWQYKTLPQKIHQHHCLHQQLCAAPPKVFLWPKKEKSITIRSCFILMFRIHFNHCTAVHYIFNIQSFHKVHYIYHPQGQKHEQINLLYKEVHNINSYINGGNWYDIHEKWDGFHKM